MTALPSLRAWQAVAIPLVMQSLRDCENGVLVAVTGSGKARVIAEVVEQWRAEHPPGVDDEGTTLLVTTPSRKLVNQLADTITEQVGPGLVGRYFTSAKQWQRPIVVACNVSVPALSTVLKANGKTVSVWIADEAHKVEVDGMRAVEGGEGDGATDAVIRAAINAQRRCALTATPFRSQADERLTLFDKVIYRYSPADALRDKVIVPWRIVGWDENRPDKVTIDQACVTLIQELGTRAERGPGVVNASTIEDAEAYCATLAAAGIVARSIHSRQSADAQAKTLELLKAGKIDCIVHVNLLVEGIDLPWLRWLCLRRPVGARIRFIQEIGRVLRSYKGKECAYILDPNDLFGAFQLSYPEALGWKEPDEPDPEEEERKREERDCDPQEKDEPEARKAARTSAIGRYVRQLLLALLAEGIAQAEKPLPGTAWRSDPASPKQIESLPRMARLSKRLCDEHQQALTRLIDTPAAITKGIASDLFDILGGLAKVARGTTWFPAAPVALPPDCAFVPVEVATDRAVHVAGVMKGGWSAIAVVQGSRVIYSGCRTSQVGDSWGMLTRSAMDLAIERAGARQIAVADAKTATAYGQRGYQGIPVLLTEGRANRAAGRAWAEINRRTKETAQ